MGKAMVAMNAVLVLVRISRFLQICARPELQQNATGTGLGPQWIRKHAPLCRSASVQVNQSTILKVVHTFYRETGFKNEGLDQPTEFGFLGP